MSTCSLPNLTFLRSASISCAYFLIAASSPFSGALMFCRCGDTPVAMLRLCLLAQLGLDCFPCDDDAMHQGSGSVPPPYLAAIKERLVLLLLLFEGVKHQVVLVAYASVGTLLSSAQCGPADAMTHVRRGKGSPPTPVVVVANALHKPVERPICTQQAPISIVFLLGTLWRMCRNIQSAAGSDTYRHCPPQPRHGQGLGHLKLSGLKNLQPVWN